MSQSAVPYSCSRCGEPLIEIEFSRHYMRVCTNWKCPLRRQPQGNRERNPEPAAITISPVLSPPNNPRKTKKKIKIKNKIKRNL